MDRASVFAAGLLLPVLPDSTTLMPDYYHLNMALAPSAADLPELERYPSRSASSLACPVFTDCRRRNGK
jgi:hypothetical protein